VDLNCCLLEYLRERVLSREAFLLKPGEVCHHLYFVESGLLRCFYHKGDKEISSRFIQEGEVGWSPESFLLQHKGTEYIQALERSHVITLSYEDIQSICWFFPIFDMVRRRITEASLIAHEQRMQAMWMQRSDERLAWFIRQFPGLLDKVTGRHIASYLGISEVMLSRRRRDI
jgi:CRP-like cAMP-binding protein